MHIITFTTLFLETNGDKNVENTIPVLYSTLGIDQQFQSELLSAVSSSLNRSGSNITPKFIQVNSSLSITQVAKNITESVMISLLSESQLFEFSTLYENFHGKVSNLNRKMVVFTPRLIDRGPIPPSMTVYSLQMNKHAAVNVLLDRMKIVGVDKLLPVMDITTNLRKGGSAYFVRMEE